MKSTISLMTVDIRDK